MAFKWKSPPPNVHVAMVAFPDLSNRDKNAGVQLGSSDQKDAFVREVFAKYMGQQIVMVHPEREQLYYLDVDYKVINGMRVPTPSTKIMLQHLLFGEWRLATEADVKRIEAAEQAKADGLARIEARRQALKAGLIFKEMATTAKAINDLNNEKPVAEPEPTEADLDALQAKIDAARMKSSDKKKLDVILKKANQAKE